MKNKTRFNNQNNKYDQSDKSFQQRMGPPFQLRLKRQTYCRGSSETMLCCRYMAAQQAPTKQCTYCGELQPPPSYQDHLLATHADLLFHCAECDSYVDRKEFIVHMSRHAADYAKQTKHQETPKKAAIKEENGHRRITRKQRRDAAKAAEAKPKVGASRPDPKNEFSDHSDPENGFDPLPESVFEAIEDAQEKAPSPPGDVPPPDKPKHKKRTCPTCGKGYTASSSYFYHMKHAHGRVKEHACEVCGKRFGTRAGLSQHAAVHTGERAYKCAQCGKRFGSRAGLYIHEQSHGGVRRWACTCGRAFRWRGGLARHRARCAPAGGSRVHACARCPRAFAVRADLVRHVRTHRRLALKCAYCDTTFAQQRYLDVHVRRKHAGGKGKAAKVNGKAAAKVTPAANAKEKGEAPVMEAATATGQESAPAMLMEAATINPSASKAIQE